jgi:mannose-6-phosphate isomerase class I
MSTLTAKRWSYASTITEEAVRAFFTPVDKYKITRSTYSPRTEFGGFSRAGICFVLSGTCQLSWDSQVVLSSGDYVEFPSGAFQLTVVGDHEVDVIKVWELSESETGAQR